jgi:sigma-B regulation protein RsbU (phosphoserine phosphatase)
MPRSQNPHVHNRLRYNVLLETLTDAEFADFEPLMKERSFEPGTVIIQDEGQGGEVFFLVEGRIRVSKPGPASEEQLIALLHPGDCFGELEAIAGRPRSALVVAEDRCVAYALASEHFEVMLRQSPAVAIRLLQVLSIRLRALNNHFVAEVIRRVAQNRAEVHTLHQLIDAAKSLNSTLDLEELLDVILKTALGIVDGDRGSVYLLDEEKKEIWTKVARGLNHDERKTIRLPLGKGIAGYVAATGDTINIPDAYTDPRFDSEFDRVTGYHTRSILCAPMKNPEGKIVGVFQLLNKRDGVFTDKDATIMDALSVHAAIAIENARLVVQEKEKIRIERDLAAAREVQTNLLPKHAPEVPGYEFAAVMMPALEVAGDLYDFIRLDQYRVAITVGDVSGKGLPAALLMAHVQASVRDVAHEASSASACTTLLNDRLAQSTGAEKFVTMVYSVLDSHNHALRYSNGGHNPPVFVNCDGPRWLTAGGTILGIVEGVTFEEEVVPLAPGDVVVLYSDGISEAMNAQQELFGDDRLQQFIAQRRNLPAERLKEEILDAVHQHQHGAPQADDMTIVIVRRLPQ